jgi:hypothetical protein
MTFFLFLLSAVVVESIVRKARPAAADPASDAKDAWGHEYLRRTRLATGVEATASLAQLSLALDQHGRGEVPRPTPEQVAKLQNR